MVDVTLTQEISAGDTSEVWEVGFVTSAKDVVPITLADLDVNFTCFLTVYRASPAITRQISSKNAGNTRFRAWLTPAETLALARGTWLVGLEIRNPALNPPLVKEAHVSVRIVKPLVPA